MIRFLRTAAALPRVPGLIQEVYAPRGDWQARLDARIREIVRFAYHRTRFYRRLWDEAGASPDSITGARDLRRLPPVGRLAWRSMPYEQLRPSGWVGPLIGYTTGGTTGSPLTLPYTYSDDIQMTAGMLAEFLRNGVRWRDLMTRPSPPLPPGIWARRVGRVLYPNIRAPLSDQVALLAAGRFPFIRSSPWAIWRVVVHCRRSRRPLPAAKILISGSEVLTGPVRRTISQALGARVIDQYASTEIGHNAAECSAGRLHIFTPTAHIEIECDGRPAGPGEAGEVIATSFVSHGRPAVRLRTGDWAAWGQGPCACGNPTPFLEYMAGREDDAIVTPSGASLRWPAFDQTLAGLGDNLLGYQVAQTDPNKLVVRLSLDVPPASNDEIAKSLRRLVADMEICIEMTDNFRVEQSGKTRPIVGLGLANF